jgi:ABC-type multidrug transport system ATPase subunit
MTSVKANEIVAQGVTKRFGRVTALDEVSVGFGTGATALLGRNGAGKTTLINLIAGVVLPTEGGLTVEGAPAGSKEAVARLARQIELPGTAGFLTARRLGSIFGLTADEKARMRELLENLSVPNRSYGKLSTGNQLKFALALAFARQRPILLLDEPTAGLDIFGVEILTRLIRERCDEGLTTLVATHQPTLTPELFHRAVVIDQGRLLYDGRLDGLLDMAPLEGEAATTRLAVAMTRLIGGVE